MDVSHELGALRFVVDSPLSSKVAMFNKQVNQHKQSQLLNPFSQADGRASPKPTFSKDEYGKPLAGSLTEMRGQKANMHVLKEMLELCQIIDSEGYTVKDEPTMRVIPFGELFNIYNYISDKVVGILLRARKHKLVEFEGEMLFQRRDDDVPVFLLKPIQEIRQELEDKIESIKRSGSSSPQATSVLLDKKAHGLHVPRGATPVSRTPSPQTSKAGTPVREINPNSPPVPAPAPTTKTEEVTKTDVVENKPAEKPTTTAAETSVQQTTEVKEGAKSNGVIENKPVEAPEANAQQIVEAKEEIKPTGAVESKPVEAPTPAAAEASAQQTPEVVEQIKPTEVAAPGQQPAPVQVSENTDASPASVSDTKTDVDNNNNNSNLPTIIIEATAVYVHPTKTEETTETTSTTNNTNTTTIIPDSASNIEIIFDSCPENEPSA